MSEIKVDTLTGKTTAGNITVTSEGGAATMQLQQGLAKAWHKANSTGTTLNDSLNVSSLGDQGTGQQVINLTNNMNNANYMGAQGLWTNLSEPFLFSQATSSYKSYVYDEASGAYIDGEQGSMIMGDLA